MMLRLLVLLHLLVAPSVQQQQRQQRQRQQQPDDYSGSTAPCTGRGTESYNGICTPSAFPPRLDPALNKQVQDPGYLRAPPALINITIGPYKIAISKRVLFYTARPRAEHRQGILPGGHLISRAPIS